MVIPVILLGEERDRHLPDALRSLLGERCAWKTRNGIFLEGRCKGAAAGAVGVLVGGCRRRAGSIKGKFFAKAPAGASAARKVHPARPGWRSAGAMRTALHPLRRHRGTADVQHAGECGRLCTNPVGSIGRQLHCAGRAPVCTAVQFERLRDALLRSCPFAAGNEEIKSILCEGLA